MLIGTLKLKKDLNFMVMLFDCIIITMSLLFAQFIRALFPAFFFQMAKLLFILPYVIIIRLLTNTFFEHYKLSYFNLNTSDVYKLFIHSLFPSLIFLLVRLTSPVSNTRLPISIIITEYFFTVWGMFVFRFFYVMRRRKSIVVKKIKRRNAALLVGHASEITKKINHAAMASIQCWDIAGILSPNKLEWDTDYQGIRILGGLELLSEYALADPSLSTIILMEDFEYEGKLRLVKECRELNLNIYRFNNGKLSAFQIEDLVSINSEGFIKVPEEVISALGGKNIQIIGSESPLLPELLYALSIMKDTRYEINSIFSPDGMSANTGQPDVVIDLKWSTLLASFSVKKDLYTGIIEYCINKNKALQESCPKTQYLVLLPLVHTAFISSELSKLDKLTILLTGNIISNYVPGKNELFFQTAFWERKKDVVGFLLKAVSCEEKKNGILLARSSDIIANKEFIQLLNLVDIEFTDQIGAEEKVETGTATLLAEVFASAKLITTKFYGLYNIETNNA